jgi:Phosphatidylglycerophosphate synthase
MDISTLNLIIGAISTILIIFSFLVSITSPQSITDYDRERVEKESRSVPEALRGIYNAVGNWLYWIVSKSKFLHNINPQSLSFMGLGLNLLGALFISAEIISLGAIFITGGGILDIIDGKVAREKRMAKKSGSLLDSVLDRIGEIAIFSSICFFLMKKGEYTFSVITALAMGFSMLVSYVRAKAESFGIKSKRRNNEKTRKSIYNGSILAFRFDISIHNTKNNFSAFRHSSNTCGKLHNFNYKIQKIV